MSRPAANADAQTAAPRRSPVRAMLALALPLGAFAGGAGTMYGLVLGGILALPENGDGSALPQIVRAKDADGVERAVITYLPLEESFTCNLKGSSRLIQVTLSVATRHDARVGESVRTHADPLRSAVLAILMEQTLEDVTSEAGKRRLREGIRAALNAELVARSGFGGIAEVFITNLIIQ